MIGQFIYSTLTGNTALAALVGTKVFPTRGSQDVSLPSLVYLITNREELNPPGMAEMTDYTVQISIYDDDYLNIDAITEAIITALDTPTNPTGYSIEAVYLDDQDDGIDDEINAYARDLNFRILTHKTT